MRVHGDHYPPVELLAALQMRHDGGQSYRLDGQRGLAQQPEREPPRNKQQAIKHIGDRVLVLGNAELAHGLPENASHLIVMSGGDGELLAESFEEVGSVVEEVAAASLIALRCLIEKLRADPSVQGDNPVRALMDRVQPPQVFRVKG